MTIREPAIRVRVPTHDAVVLVSDTRGDGGAVAHVEEFKHRVPAMRSTPLIAGSRFRPLHASVPTANSIA